MSRRVLNDSISNYYQAKTAPLMIVLPVSSFEGGYGEHHPKAQSTQASQTDCPLKIPSTTKIAMIEMARLSLLNPMTISRHTDITPHIPIDRLAYLDRQEALFDAAKPHLLITYLGEFVAFENGIVLDHDTNEQALAQRVFAQRPNQDLLIRQVLEQEPILMVRGARFA